MKKLILYLFIAFSFSGCVAVQQSVVEDQTVEVKKQETVVDQKPPVVEIQVTKEEAVEQVETVEPEVIKGVIFGKTQFEGVLDRRDVRFLLQSLESSQLSFQFQISGADKEQILPWDVKRLDPGYFFIELPVGEYQISKVSILVGTTLASEDIDIKFVVGPELAVYIGTLNINGTKERIKLGGVPVIRPGFDYEVKIIDEEQEAEQIFYQRFPNLETEIIKGLMQVSFSDNP